jgi:hypothetical protein
METSEHEQEYTDVAMTAEVYLQSKQCLCTRCMYVDFTYRLYPYGH